MNKNKNKNIRNTVRETFRYLAEDVLVSNDSIRTGKNNHDMIVGSSCAGKTGGYVTPNILANTDHSMVVVDTKSLLYRRYSGYLKKKGFRVVNLDFINPMNSAVYNPLDFVEILSEDGDQIEYRQQDLKSIAKVLAPDEMDTREVFWVESARKVLVSLMAYAMEKVEKPERNMVTVAKLFLLMGQYESGPDEDKNAGVEFFEQLRKENPESFAVMMYDTYKENFRVEKMWVSIKAFVANALEIFLYQDISRMFDGSSALELKDLGHEKTVLFVNISDTDRAMYNIINVFYQQLFQALCKDADTQKDGRLPVPVRIIMDDYANNFRIPDFDKIISVIRSRQIFVSIILQSLSQLEGMYQPAIAKTILNNCDYKVFFGGQDVDTARMVADMAQCIPERITRMKAEDVCILERGEKIRFAKKIAPYSMDKEMEM